VSDDAKQGRRVAFVLGSSSGGTASHVGALITGCRAAGVAVTVFAPAGTLALVAADTASLTVPIGAGPRPDRDVAAIIRLRAGLARYQPEVVHAHGVRAGAFAALAIATLLRRARPALVVTVHNAPPRGGAARIVYGALEWVCARRADIVLCASADLLTRMRVRGARAEQFDVPAPERPAPTAADVAAVRAELDARERPIVLAVARLAPQKGLDVLIGAASRWRDRAPQPRTVIAGAGPLAAALQVAASRSGADVVLLGPRCDVPALLAAADVVVASSSWEARALVIQEAMRAGRPIVATRVGGIPELTGADGALLVPPDDPAALADAVTAVLDDASLAARLGAAARQRSATFPTEQDAVRAALATYARLAPSKAAPAGGRRLDRQPQMLRNNRPDPPD
jgi:glycosyltransferase involved in cell wall biosynthesis